jgi:hypothetical protein
MWRCLYVQDVFVFTSFSPANFAVHTRTRSLSLSLSLARSLCYCTLSVTSLLVEEQGTVAKRSSALQVLYDQCVEQLIEHLCVRSTQVDHLSNPDHLQVWQDDPSHGVWHFDEVLFRLCVVWCVNVSHGLSLSLSLCLSLSMCTVFVVLFSSFFHFTHVHARAHIHPHTPTHPLTPHIHTHSHLPIHILSQHSTYNHTLTHLLSLTHSHPTHTSISLTHRTYARSLEYPLLHAISHQTPARVFSCSGKKYVLRDYLIAAAVTAGCAGFALTGVCGSALCDCMRLLNSLIASVDSVLPNSQYRSLCNAIANP